MKKLIFSCFLFLSILSITKAQDYSTAVGVRGGWAYGLTVKHFLTENAAIEGIFSSRWQGFNITGLYEIHANAFDVDGLAWYYGGGGHIGFWDGSKNDRWFDDDDNYTVIGIDGIVGLEYTISEIPINISLDWKPAFNIIGHSGFWGDGGALSVRWYFY